MFFINSMLAHSYIPKILLEGSVKPGVKNPFGSRTDSTNVALSAIFQSRTKFQCHALQRKGRKGAKKLVRTFSLQIIIDNF